MSDLLERLQRVVGDRYRVERELGSGGMALVFLAQDLKHARPVALKVFRPELATALGPERFLREIEIAASLQHPNIVPVYDSGAAEGVFYYVMPFIEGESLRERMDREGPLPPATARAIAREVAAALGYAHDRGLIHRDIKPENVMLTAGQAMVTDFGIARAIAAGAQRLTGTGLAIGTPAYMSPEQALGEEALDGRTDIYSLGCVLYEMLAGKPPFAGATLQAIVAETLSGARPRLRSVRADVPAGLDTAVSRALAREPADRFATVREFADAVSDDRPAGVTVSRRAAIGVAVAVIGLLVGAWWFTARSARAVVPGAETIAVLPFTVSGDGVDYLEEGMVDLLSRNLDAVGGIRAVDPRTVMHRWERAARRGTPDRAGALAVGRQVGAGSVISGSVVAAGPAVRMTAELTTVDGTVLARAGAEGRGDAVLALVDTLSLRLLREIWRSGQTLPNVHLSGITTGSVDAARSYLTGERFYRRSEWDSAIVAFRRAVEIDSTFALAWFRLGLAHGWATGLGGAAARAASEQAVRHAGRLPDRARTLVTAHRLFEQTRTEAHDTMMAYVAQYPDDPEGWHLLGDIQFHAQPVLGLALRQQYQPFERAMELDPGFTPTYEHPIDLSLMLSDSASFYRYLEYFDSAGGARETALYRAAGAALWRHPDSLVPVILRLARERASIIGSLSVGLMNSASGSPQPVFDAIERLQATLPPGPQRAQFSVRRGMMLVSMGRLRDAERLADSVLPVSRDLAAAILQQPIITGIAPPGYAERVFQKLGIDPARTAPSPPARYWQVVHYLSRGDAAGARRLLQSARADRADTATAPVRLRPAFDGLEGWVRLVEGDTVGGVRQLRLAIREMGFGGAAMGFSQPLRFRLATALAARAETREEGLNRLRYAFSPDPQYAALGYLAAAQALEAQGDRPGAARAYGDVVRLWKNADPELQPEVESARQAIERLTGEPQPLTPNP